MARAVALRQRYGLSYGSYVAALTLAAVMNVGVASACGLVACLWFLPTTGAVAPFVPLGADGSISIYNSAGSTHLAVDVLGWFPVGATTTRVNEDGHERFNGSVSNSQSYDLSSYFVTEFTATCRVTKFHTKSNYEYPIVVPATGTHHGFRWVDP